MKDFKALLLNNIDKFDNNNVELIQAIHKIANGQNLFITGEGGTGKSHFIATLCKILSTINIRIVTPTGTAAVNINDALKEVDCLPLASTYHSFYGFIPNMSDKVLSKASRSNISKIDLLIIDEVSMIPSIEFDRMSFRHSNPHKNTDCLKEQLVNSLFSKEQLFTECFKDTQVILIGDLFQLPPVLNYDVKKYTYNSKYIFDSVTYKLGKFETISLYKNYRVKQQINEKDKMKYSIFKRMLTDIRYNSLSATTLKALKMLNTHRVIPKDKIIDLLINDNNIFLSPYNKECKDYNEIVKNQLNTKSEIIPTYSSSYIYTLFSKLGKKEQNDYLNRTFDIDAEVEFKIGQRVMITINKPSYNLSNGDIGVITGFEYFENKVVGVVINIQRGDNTSFYVIKRETSYRPTPFEIERMATLPNPFPTDLEKFLKSNIAIWSSFLPLKDAYAITIHKCQGKTFKNKVIINPNGFADAQFYVALSRAVALDNIFITSEIRKSHIKADIEVLKHYLANGLIEEYMVEQIESKINENTSSDNLR